MRGQEQEQEQEEREIRETGYEFRKLFCSLQPRGFVTSNKHETACSVADPARGSWGSGPPPQ